MGNEEIDLLIALAQLHTKKGTTAASYTVQTNGLLVTCEVMPFIPAIQEEEAAERKAP